MFSLPFLSLCYTEPLPDEILCADRKTIQEEYSPPPGPNRKLAEWTAEKAVKKTREIIVDELEVLQQQLIFGQQGSERRILDRVDADGQATRQQVGEGIGQVLGNQSSLLQAVNDGRDATMQAVNDSRDVALQAVGQQGNALMAGLGQIAIIAQRNNNGSTGSMGASSCLPCGADSVYVASFFI